MPDKTPDSTSSLRRQPSPEPRLRPFSALALVTDAFGGHGGIALYNRDFLSALSSHPQVSTLDLIPRLMPFEPEPLPANINHITASVGGKLAYLKAFIRHLATAPRPSVIVCGHINLLPLAAIARLVTGAPVILEIYGIDAWQPTGNPITNALVRSVDSVVSISQVTLDRFLAWSSFPPSRCHLLPNAIHTGQYGPAPKPEYLVERYGLAGRPTLMTFGRLVSKERSKGFDEVLEALPALIGRYPNIAYLIAGTGPDRDRLEKRAAELGVSDHVVFTGFIDEKEKADHYRLADAYVMPSRGEGFGFVFLEALACGIPAVGSRTDGSREALRDGLLGDLVDPDDQQEIVRAATAALENTSRVPPAGLGYFSFENFTTRLHRIVDQTITN